MKRFNFKKTLTIILAGFTLAEVLITIGIIGIVAEITIPELTANFQKQKTVTRLKDTYSMLYQAIRFSEIDNGDITTWSYPTQMDGNAAVNWVNTYLANYLKTTSIQVSNYDSMVNVGAKVYLNNGIILKFWCHDPDRMHVEIFINGDNNSISGKDIFVYFIGGTPTVSSIKELRPYDFSLTIPVSRNTLLTDPLYGCNKPLAADAPYCSQLIMTDGWQISSDYPYFN